MRTDLRKLLNPFFAWGAILSEVSTPTLSSDTDDLMLEIVYLVEPKTESIRRYRLAMKCIARGCFDLRVHGVQLCRTDFGFAGTERSDTFGRRSQRRRRRLHVAFEYSRTRQLQVFAHFEQWQVARRLGADHVVVHRRQCR